MTKPRRLTKAERIQEAHYAHALEEYETLGIKPWQALPCDVRNRRCPDGADPVDWARAQRQYREIIARDPHHYDDLK